jgi:hypothetical protein
MGTVTNSGRISFEEIEDHGVKRRESGVEIGLAADTDEDAGEQADEPDRKKHQVVA